MSGSILIVSRNNLHLTKLAVRSALYQDVPVMVMLMDNYSSDGTLSWMKSKPLIIPIHTEKQLSLAACWNKGLKAFFQSGSDEVLILNNDIEIRPDTYKMLRSMNQPFVTCVSVDTPDRLGVAGDRSPNEILMGARPHPDFSCFMIRREVTNRVGWFDESYYPAYCEDNDYHVRMHRAGVKAICVDLPFLHHAAATVKSAEPGEVDRIKRGAIVNREKFRLQYGCIPGTKEYEELFV